MQEQLEAARLQATASAAAPNPTHSRAANGLGLVLPGAAAAAAAEAASCFRTGAPEPAAAPPAAGAAAPPLTTASPGSAADRPRVILQEASAGAQSIGGGSTFEARRRQSMDSQARKHARMNSWQRTLWMFLATGWLPRTSRGIFAISSVRAHPQLRDLSCNRLTVATCHACCRGARRGSAAAPTRSARTCTWRATSAAKSAAWRTCSAVRALLLLLTSCSPPVAMQSLPGHLANLGQRECRGCAPVLRSNSAEEKVPDV